MKPKFPAALAIAGLACLLLAGCQTDDGEVPDTVFRSLAKVAADDAADYDSFGLSVAVDGNYALVGAPGRDVNGSNSGAAYLYLQSQGGLDAWGQAAMLVAGDPADGDLFGMSVDISGDVAVVGAAGDDGTGSVRGAAYIFYRYQGGADVWGQVKKIAAADAANGDAFGNAVALDGNILIVGADGEDGAGTDRGAAYIFARDQGGPDNWGQVAKLQAGDPADGVQFGFSVDIAGDVAIVGAPGESLTGTDRGAAYVYSRDLGGADAWGLVKKITAGDGADDDLFGVSVSLGGAFAVVGAAWVDGDGTNRGAAYLFGKDQGGADSWGPVKKLTASDAHNNDIFGYHVDVDGDLIVVGAPWSLGGGTERGQVYVFSRNEGGADNWGQAQILRASDAANKDWLGSRVALDGLYLIVGATGEDGSGVERGAAYVFRKL